MASAQSGKKGGVIVFFKAFFIQRKIIHNFATPINEHKMLKLSEILFMEAGFSEILKIFFFLNFC